MLGKEREKIGPLHGGGLKGDAEAPEEPDGEKHRESPLHQAHGSAGKAVHAAEHRELQRQVQDLGQELQKEQEEAKAEEARAEAPKTEEPKAEAPKAEPEAPKAEESAPAEEEDDEGEYELDLGDEPEDEEAVRGQA